MTIETKDDLVDFAALAAVLTNEQKILASSLRIEALLAPIAENSQYQIDSRKAAVPSRAEQLDALIPKDATSGRKGAQAPLAKGFSRK
jgi:hypothetical protein